MNTENYFNSLRKKLRSIFLIIKNGHEVPLDEKRYVEGFMHASLELGLATRAELDQMMEALNQEVFGMSIAQRRRHYRQRKLSPGTSYETPTYQRKGIKLALGEED